MSQRLYSLYWGLAVEMSKNIVNEIRSEVYTELPILQTVILSWYGSTVRGSKAMQSETESIFVCTGEYCSLRVVIVVKMYNSNSNLLPRINVHCSNITSKLKIVRPILFGDSERSIKCF